MLALGTDLRNVWQAPTTTARDKKELLRALLEEVIIAVNKDEGRSHLTLRWRGGALAEIDLDLPRRRVAPVRTDEDTVALVRRLAVHYPDRVIAGVLNRQQRTTAYGHRFTANNVGSLRRQWNIARYEPPTTPAGADGVAQGSGNRQNPSPDEAQNEPCCFSGGVVSSNRRMLDLTVKSTAPGEEVKP